MLLLVLGLTRIARTGDATTRLVRSRALNQPWIARAQPCCSQPGDVDLGHETLDRAGRTTRELGEDRRVAPPSIDR